MQIKINSSRKLGHNSINHVESLLETYHWNILPTFVTVNIDFTLKDVDDTVYLQLITQFGEEKKSLITDAKSITEALKTAMSTLNGRISPSHISIHTGNETVFKAA